MIIYYNMYSIKKLFVLLAMLAVGSVAWSQSAKVVHVTKALRASDYEDYVVEPGVYPVRSFNGNKLEIGMGQDCAEIPRSDFKIETWTAAQGHGYIIGGYNRTGTLNVRSKPSTSGAVVGRIQGNKNCDCIPEEYECLGKTKDWFKIRINGRVGYIREDLVEWQIHMSDCGGCIR